MTTKEIDKMEAELFLSGLRKKKTEDSQTVSDWLALVDRVTLEHTALEAILHVIKLVRHS